MMENVTRIMVFGTFDMVHKGHLNFFKQARGLAKKSYLIVSIARDANVKRIKNQRPLNSQKERMEIVRVSSGADKVALGGVNDHMPHIVKEQPDIIALGYDQWAYVKNLKSELIAAGLTTKIVRLKPYKEHLYKTSILKFK